ncbi:MAG: T9SS type A sorting domain-containing protein, partial [Bacteroidia bacterium]|nr:T9SS type A sorting domain-containing protein [Bacteroidia bacterium]MDW8158000.1 T9SS type A sorting domain-containing protein [Bacteroidia bacterium]
NGTTRPGPINAGNQRLYISQHGLEKNIPAPPVGYKNRVDGVWVRFAPTTRRVFAADTFHINVYNFENNRLTFLGRQRFRLNDPRFIEQPIDGMNYHYIEFEDDVAVSGNAIFALETKTATSNDTITFFFTIPGRSDTLTCGHQWRIFLADSATHMPFPALPLYNSIFRNNNNDFFGNPCFIPVIEYYREPLSVNAGNDTTIECGTEAKLRAIVRNAGPDVSYQWEPTRGLSDPNIPNPIAKPLETTTYTVTVKSGDQVARDAVTVFVRTRFRADAGRDQAITCGDSVVLGTPVLPLPNLRYRWEPTTGLSNPTSPNPIAKPTQTTSYTLSVTDGNCTARDTVVIRVNPIEIQVSASSNAIICGDEVKLEAKSNVSGLTFEWSPTTWLENPRAASTVARPESTITYLVTARRGECSASARVSLGVTPLTVDAGQWRVVRKGESTNLQARSNKNDATFSWQPTTYLDNPTIRNPKSTPERTITYTVTAKNGNCTATDTVTVHVTIPTSVSTQATRANILSLYPNPTSGKCFIEYKGNAPQLQLRLYNLQGQLLINKLIESREVQHYELDLAWLTKGLYNIELSDGNIQRSFKIELK